MFFALKNCVNFTASFFRNCIVQHAQTLQKGFICSTLYTLATNIATGLLLCMAVAVKKPHTLLQQLCYGLKQQVEYFA